MPGCLRGTNRSDGPVVRASAFGAASSGLIPSWAQPENESVENKSAEFTCCAVGEGTKWDPPS